MRLQVDREHGRVRTDRLGKPNLEMVVLPRPEKLDPSVVTGQADPVQGWVAADGEDLPAPVVFLRARRRLPFRFGTALIPYDTGNSAGVSCRVLASSAASVAVEILFRTGPCDTVLFRASPRGRERRAGLDTDAEVAVVREGGRRPSALRVGGSFLRWKGRPLLPASDEACAEA